MTVDAADTPEAAVGGALAEADPEAQTDPEAQANPSPAASPQPLPEVSRRAPQGYRTRKSVVWLATAAVVTGAAGALAVARPWHEDGGGPTATALAHGTAVVRRGSLSSGIQVTGTLGYDRPTGIVGQGHGTITALPAAGDVVKAGQRLYEVDGVPVPLLTGDRPMWRDLGPGVPDGPDVEQLKRNLVALGFGGGLSVDQSYTSETEKAVERWQKALGVTPTGTVALGSVVMLPLGTARVQQVSAQLGSPVGSGVLLTVTAVNLVATVQPADNQLSQFKPGGKVGVRLADGSQATGRIRSVVPGGNGSGNDSGASGGNGSGDASGGAAKTTVTIALDSQDQAQKAGPSTVTVTVISGTVSNALIVPVTALLALEGGGYGVEAVNGAGRRLVRVDLGLVADADAQVTGDLKPGDQVEVPQ